MMDISNFDLYLGPELQDQKKNEEQFSIEVLSF